jgi:hypothetical protein
MALFKKDLFHRVFIDKKEEAFVSTRANYLKALFGFYI